MSKPYDVTTKELLEAGPAAWLKLAGIEVTAPVVLIDSDVSTISMDADKVVEVLAEPPWIVHVELQSGSESRLPMRVQRYNVVLEYKHAMPVLSVVVLLRPEADSPSLTGEFRRCLPDGACYDVFQYRLLRVWEIPAERLLEGDLATLPLAPIAAVAAEDVPAVIDRARRRLDKEATSEDRRNLLAAIYLLMGLRFTPEMTDKLFLGDDIMRESTTYQAVLAEGRARGLAEGRAEGQAVGQAKEARRLLLRLGQKRWGAPDAAIQSQVESITDLDRLEQLIEATQAAESWAGLLN